ncbi:NAD(P)/FAD-dependent oxidoreductase [Caldimonas sp. KR1-144]|uniref:NAD(P)/FAD-dependent oxidoreductase n=1 Tax=Caldimonas sp. KR1-144 TaxID=3400911 RepID=UPI003C09159F
MSVRTSDVVVVGAGPAGLTVACGLRRSGRRVVVLDDGRSAAREIDHVGNYPGRAPGLPGQALLQELLQQLDAAHGTVTDRCIASIERVDGGFELPGEWHRLRFRCLVLATGCGDPAPAIPGLQGVRYRQRLWHRSMGNEAMLAGRRVAVVGGARAVADALFLAHAGAVVTLFDSDADAACESRLECCAQPIRKLLCPTSGEVVARLADQSLRRFDWLCVASAREPRVELALALGVALAPDGHVLISSSCATSVPGVYAVGDVASPCGQLAIAVGHGAIAADAINRRFDEGRDDIETGPAFARPGWSGIAPGIVASGATP